MCGTSFTWTWRISARCFGNTWWLSVIARPTRAFLSSGSHWDFRQRTTRARSTTGWRPVLTRSTIVISRLLPFNSCALILPTLRRETRSRMPYGRSDPVSRCPRRSVTISPARLGTICTSRQRRSMRCWIHYSSLTMAPWEGSSAETFGPCARESSVTCSVIPVTGRRRRSSTTLEPSTLRLHDL